MRRQIVVAGIMILTSLIYTLPVEAAVSDYWNPDSINETDAACTDDIDSSGDGALSRVVYTYGYRTSDNNTDEYLYAFDESGREMFVIRKGRRNYFGELSGVETIDLYSSDCKVVIHDWSDSASEDERDIEVIVSQNNKIIGYEKYYDWNSDTDVSVLDLDSPVEQFSVEYSADGKDGRADNGNEYQYENGCLVRSVEDDIQYKYTYNRLGDRQTVSLVGVPGEQYNIKYFNVYDKKKLVMQQETRNGVVVYSASYEYEIPDGNSLSGYWIEEDSEADRTLLVFSANGYFCTAHLEQKFGIPLVDSLGEYTFDSEKSYLKCSGNENFSVAEVETDGICKLSDEEMVFIDGKKYRKIG